MKKVIFILVCIFLINLSNCFSQLVSKNKKKIESKTSVVYGYSNEFKDLYLGITFGKVKNTSDTTYYIKFQLSAPTSEFQGYIYILKSRAITFLSKSGKIVDLNLTDVISKIENNEYYDGPFNKITINDYSTIFILNVTKEKLIEISSEPFYNLILPYYNCSTKVENKAIFKMPTLFTRKTFTQKSVKYILDI
jgi:hypothetical protein